MADWDNDTPHLFNIFIIPRNATIIESFVGKVSQSQSLVSISECQSQLSRTNHRYLQCVLLIAKLKAGVFTRLCGSTTPHKDHDINEDAMASSSTERTVKSKGLMRG